MKSQKVINMKPQTIYSDISCFSSCEGDGMKVLLYKKMKKGEIYPQPLRDKNSRLVYENRYKLIQQHKSGCDFKSLLANANSVDDADRILNVNSNAVYADIRNMPKNVDELQDLQMKKAYKKAYDDYLKKVAEIKKDAKQKENKQSEKDINSSKQLEGKGKVKDEEKV